MNAPSGQNAISQAMAHFCEGCHAQATRLDGLRVGRRRRPTLRPLNNAPEDQWLLFLQQRVEILIGNALVVHWGPG